MILKKEQEIIKSIKNKSSLKTQGIEKNKIFKK